METLLNKDMQTGWRKINKGVIMSIVNVKGGSLKLKS